MDLASLRAQQIELASSVIREDRLDKDPPDLIAGADVGFEQGGEVTRAAMVLLKYPSLELVEYKVARIGTTMPYIRVFFPSANILRCWQRGRCCRKAGFSVCRWSWDLASSPSWRRQPFGLLVDVPTIGVAKKRLCGKFEPLSANRARWPH